ncbi:MAG: hypothetical protein ACJ8AI_07100 [Rhodopila sp.]
MQEICRKRPILAYSRANVEGGKSFICHGRIEKWMPAQANALSGQQEVPVRVAVSRRIEGAPSVTLEPRSVKSWIKQPVQREIG